MPHNRRQPWEPPEWREMHDLCESGPFRGFCGSSLPTEDQRVICDACGLPKWGSEVHRHFHQHDLQPWEEPYVWELDTF